MMLNIDSLHASSLEMRCDQKNDIACTMEVPMGPDDIIVGRSNGYLIIRLC